MEETNTPVIELFSAGNHFEEVSRRHARLHRQKTIAKEYWWVVLVSLALTALPVVWLLNKLPPVYESKAAVWITGTLNISEGKIYIDELNNMMGTQAELIRSRTIQERAMDQTRKEFPILSAVSWTNRVVVPFKLLVKESVKSSIFQLVATGAEPQSTTAFLRHVIEEYLNYKQEVRTNTLARNLGSMSNEVTQLNLGLRAKQKQLLDFQATNSMALLQEQGNSSAAYQAEVNRQLSILRTESNLLAILRPEQLLEIDAKPVSTGPASTPGDDAARGLLVAMAGPSADYAKASEQIQLLRAKQTTLGVFLKTNHPKMANLARDIGTQEKLMQIYRDASATQLVTRLESVRLRIQNLEESFRLATTQAVAASRIMGEYERLKQDIQRDQVPFDRLNNLIQSMDVSKTLDPETSNVMEQASVALPKGRMWLVLGLGAAVGLGVGLGTIFLIAVLDDRFASIAELRGLLNETVIGHIPEIPMRSGKGKLEKEMTKNDRKGFLEAFRNIRSSLLFTGALENRPRTLLVTSSVPTEGKSTVATYLSATLALGGARVLLIDGDLRRSMLHKNFGLPNERGLANIMNEGLDPAAAIVQTTLSNLWFLPAGQSNRNPGELFLNSKLDELLKRVREEYDFVLFDSPPVMAADDSSTLAPRMDQVLFVVRGSFTSARTAREALGVLHQRGVKSIGLIFNRGLTSSHEQYRYTYKEYYKKPPALLNGGRSGTVTGKLRSGSNRPPAETFAGR